MKKLVLIILAEKDKLVTVGIMICLALIITITTLSVGCGSKSTPTEEYSIVAKAFLDTTGIGGLYCRGCNGEFEASDWPQELITPLPTDEITFILLDRHGVEIGRQSPIKGPHTGVAVAKFTLPARLVYWEPGRRDPFVIKMDEKPKTPFLLCPNAKDSWTTSGSELWNKGTINAVFPFWLGCPPRMVPMAPN